MKIGLTQRVLYHKGRSYDSIEQGWYSYLKEHALVCVPNYLDQDFDRLSEELDILIITGGDDSAIRRATELKLASRMMLQRKPILGVCHGAFLLTDVLNGQVGYKDGHQDTEHSVYYNDQSQAVNSFHTLCITQAPDTAQVLVVDCDQHCEAWIDHNIAAVVWHPERMASPWLPDEIENLLF